ncbi:MAG: carbohydrate binding domain-containing protein [Allomuricauda sp.]
MDKNKNNKNISNSSLSLFALIFMLGILGIIISCETEDDTPPPSAYVEPEPEPEPEGCVFETIVPELADGLDFECAGPEVTFFGEKDGSFTLEYVENPDASGANTSERVVEYMQTNGVEPWAGFFFDLAGKVDFSEKQTIKLKVYSPAADQTVLVKLEDSSDGSINKEVQGTTTVANQWEELSFAFATSDSDKYDRLVLFFNFNGDKGAPTTHYFDDITLAEGGDTGGPGEASEPTTTAPDPTVDSAEVISLFSDVYTNVPVDTWRTDWSNATLEDVTIEGNATKKYSALSFVGVETVANQIDATAMTHFHTDIWTADATEFRIKLVDFGADAAFGGGDDVEHEIVFDSPAQQEWVSLDIPLSDFTGLITQEHIAQLIYVGAPSQQNTVFVDNVYFYNIAGVSTEPTIAAPTPTVPEANVISVFSDAYTDVVGTDFNPNWGQATVTTQVDVAGNNTLKYENLNYQGTQFATPLDVSGMSMLHIDFWTADSSALNGYLISTGPAETPHAFAITTGEWVSVDIPLTEFSGVVDLMDVIQLKFDGNGTIYLDNIYFFNPPATEPTSAAPTPSVPEADVISMFSDAYTDVPVDTWRTDWSVATLEDIMVDGDAVKKYSALNFVGVETVANQIDATAMTHFHTDVWTADATEVRIKLVDFGANGAYDGGGDDVEHEITISNPEQGTWISLDIPLSDFTGLTTRAHIAQLIYSGQPAGSMTIFVDNVYFHQ